MSFLRVSQCIAAITLLASAALAEARVIGPSLQRALITAAPDAELQIVVTFKGSRPLTDSQVAQLKAIGVRGYRFDALPMAGLVATPDQIQRILGIPGVRSIWANDAMQFDNAGATAITGVQRLRATPGFTKRNNDRPITGRGVGVLVNDSGIDATHEDLKLGETVVQNVFGWSDVGGSITDLTGNTILPHTPRIENMPHTDLVFNSHGTHVSGIVGGSGEMSDGKYAGVAPGANIIGHSTGLSALLLNLLGGFDYALARQSVYNIRVVTNSWGCSSCAGDVFDADDPVNVATKLCADAQMVVVFSAGNSGNGPDTITGNYKKAPWVVTVAAGSKHGGLVDFSSRGKPGYGVQKITLDGEEFDLTDRPTVVSPGWNIISARAKAADPVAWGLALTPYFDLVDPAEVEPEMLPFYTAVSGTSQAAPHVAGIVALMLEANPNLGWRDVKRILQATATNLPGVADWEGGAGFVNAFNAVSWALGFRQDYGATSKLTRNFNSSITSVGAGTTSQTFSTLFTPVGPPVNIEFDVAEGVVLVKAEADSVASTVGISLTNPEGTRYASAIQVGPGTISISAPAMAGRWTARVRGIGSVAGQVLSPPAALGLPFNGYATPEPYDVVISQTTGAEARSGLDDIVGHAAQGFIETAVKDRLVDGRASGLFEPDARLKRIELAEYLTLGALRQTLKLNRQARFTDVPASLAPFAEAVSTLGATLKFGKFDTPPPIARDTTFAPDVAVLRTHLAVAMVRALAMNNLAAAHVGPVTADNDGERIPVTDLGTISTGLYGFIQIAIDRGLVAVDFVEVVDPVTQATSLEARFKPTARVTRAEFAASAINAAIAYAPHVDTTLQLPLP